MQQQAQATAGTQQTVIQPQQPQQQQIQQLQVPQPAVMQPQQPVATVPQVNANYVAANLPSTVVLQGQPAVAYIP